MIKINFLIIMLFTLHLLACSEKKKHMVKTQANSTLDISLPKTKSDVLLQTDTAIIDTKKFVLSVFKTGASAYFKVEKLNGQNFKTILVDSDYTTNNSSLFFNDQNNDGFLDIVWTKKWQDHSYLFNPVNENFYEVGEFHNIDTLKINGQIVLFQRKYPLLFLRNLEKEFEWMTELHSELFIISNFQKISLATIDNFASLNDWNIEKCSSNKSVVVNCYVPPYMPKFGKQSIWNSGKSVDSVYIKANQFDSTFIAAYWTKNYQRLLKYGQVFKVRRAKDLKYY